MMLYFIDVLGVHWTYLWFQQIYVVTVKSFLQACFLCNLCKMSLVDKAFGTKEEKIYCGNCYDSSFGQKCDGCSEIFRVRRWAFLWRNWMHWVGFWHYSQAVFGMIFADFLAGGNQETRVQGPTVAWEVFRLRVLQARHRDGFVCAERERDLLRSVLWGEIRAALYEMFA